MGIRTAALDFKPRMDVVSPFSVKSRDHIEVARRAAAAAKKPAPMAMAPKVAKLPRRVDDFAAARQKGADAQRKPAAIPTHVLRRPERQRRSKTGADWPQMVMDLQASGMKVREIAELLDCDISLPSQWRREKAAPGAAMGEKFMALYRTRTGREEVPMVDGSAPA